MKTNAVTVYVQAPAAGLEVDQITKEHFHISVRLKGVCNCPLFAHLSLFDVQVAFALLSLLFLILYWQLCCALAPLWLLLVETVTLTPAGRGKGTEL